MAYIQMFKHLWQYAEKERWKVVVYILLHAISILGELGKPFAFAMVLNALQKNSPNVINEVLHWLLFYTACFFVFEIFHRSARFIERYVAFRNRKRFVTTMYDHLQTLPLSWHSDNHSGAVIDRVNKAADALYEFGQSQMMFVNVFMKFWGPMIILWKISKEIAIIAMMVGFLIVFVTKKLYSLSVPEYRAQNQAFHDVALALHDYVSNITTIIMLRLGKYVKKDIEERINRAFPHLKKENRITHIKCFSTGFLMLLLDVGLIFYYIYSQKQANALIKIGSVAAIFEYIKQFMMSFQFYAGDYESVIHWKTDFEAIRPILDEKSKVVVLEEVLLNEWKKIDVKSLDFSYGDEKYDLKDISISLYKGKKIAFVGESGAGKSTLLKILRGLVSTRRGKLKVDEDKELPISVLAKTTTLIPQEPEIFENTVRYNITMGMISKEEDIESAIWTAGFNDVVKKLPTGVESDVREKGVNLSGGEKQRLALARGIFAIKDSKIVLLDEPTSNVDPAMELTIFRRLFEILSEKCVVSVLHRLHLVRLFDYVYVLKEGRIVEEGTFEHLRENNGEFTRLWNKYLAEEELEEMDKESIELNISKCY
ncbi:ABC transporter ATP-binding protein [Abyssisolibacter fermentans]|uniref:ABC transporter ATP-binding protein n=1 Tax=Abyssisolibacter fermentans TaxID=1766203 RepID=UPI00082A6D53|nr:ABC transporter ATP-binding protein [Abyssisolibacter fermentans]